MWTIVGGMTYRDGHGTRTKGNAVNIYAEIENLKGIAEILTDIQREFDDREIDLSEAITRINKARDILEDITSDLEV
jgi:hypothetical protein